MRKTFRIPRTTGLLICAAVVTQAHAATAWRISEVLTAEAVGPGGTYGAYVELYAPSSTAGQRFDLVVFDATDTRRWWIHSVTTLTTVADRDTYIVHTGDWPTDTPPASERRQAALNMGYDLGAARTLALFDHDTGLIAGHRDQAGLLAEGGLADAVTFEMGGVQGIAFDGETVHTIALGDALWRKHDAIDYTDEFITGPVDEQFTFIGTSQQLDPGARNLLSRAVHMPEPISAVGWWVCLALAGSGRRGRRGHRLRAAVR